MARQTAEMLRLVRQAFLQSPGPMPARVADLGRTIHGREKVLTAEVMGQLQAFPWSLGPAQHLAFAPAVLERLGDSAEALARAVETMHREGAPFSERAIADVARLFSESATVLEAIDRAARAADSAALRAVADGGGRVQTLCDEAARGHEERLVQAVCLPRASSIFLAMLDSFREIARYGERLRLQLEKALAPG